ncbi:hypothetical protein AB6T38_03365 [Aliiglaciecola sp. SL4]|uniref:hypothetical protein n=1 Tax=Aliiglaciecola sp. SL4 TaxID=3239806 RepID=UPI00355B55CC
MKLWEHGNYVVGKCRQVILYSGRGPWNDEALEKGIKNTGDATELVDKSRPWGQITCLYGESLFPPSTYEIFLEQNRIRKNNGITCIAVVILNSDISNTIKQQRSIGYEATGIDYAFFDSVDNSIPWLESKKIELDVTEIKTFFENSIL